MASDLLDLSNMYAASALEVRPRASAHSSALFVEATRLLRVEQAAVATGGLATDAVARAAALFARALALEPDDEVGRCDYGVALRRLGRPDEARGRAARVAARRAFRARALCSRFFSLGLGERDDMLRPVTSSPTPPLVLKARVEFLKAVELDPAYAEAHCNLGELALDAGDARGAVARFRRSIGASAEGFSFALRGLAAALAREPVRDGHRPFAVGIGQRGLKLCFREARDDEWERDAPQG